MSGTDRRVLGVDFGTTNSYFSVCPPEEISPQGIDFEGRGRDGLATAILYEGNEIFLVGDKAIEEYSDALPEERRALTLMMQFKPDISESERAKKATIDFLSSVLSTSQERGFFILPEDMHVIFGVPSDANEEYKSTLKEVAQDAGYGEIELVDEPTGAIIHHVAQREIPVSAAFSPGLVVDFGGGTCDFTIMDNGRVKWSWGDFALGGRLLDDLFFQWFLDQDPSAEKRLRKDRCETFFLLSICKDAKEHFSRTMEKDKKQVVHKRMWEYGRLEGLTWELFLERAMNYRPSDVLLNFLLSGGISLPDRLRSGAAIDLLEWFRSTLREGLSRTDVDKKSIKYVILTGGSSLWLFAKDIVEEEFAGLDVRIVRSTRPYAAIAKGLSALPALKKKFDETKGKIQKDKEEFIKKEIEPYLVEHMDHIAEEIAQEIVIEFFDKQVHPVMLEFRKSETDLSLKELEKRVSEQAEIFKPRIEHIIKEKVDFLSRASVAAVIEKTRVWLGNYRIAIGEERLRPEAMGTEKFPILSLSSPGDKCLAIGKVMSGIMSGVLVSVVCGGSGMALIATGPVGIIIGAILGGIAGLVIGAKSADKLKDKKLGRWARARIMSNKAILRVRKKFHNKLREELKEQLEKVEAELTQHLEKIVDTQIEALSEICQL
ncbi:MAG: Hsp70 family protein [Deltaproteobacteria bacterium]|nr:Hsp70 family protein [Deltaproteobacteria bacterium]MBW1977883.1 Hsp70 family protein [Deltaproteobacteria bacterium]MBW2045288.1 Hsp70 family protein [Deltaproteobacteria bacterium]MBW2301426.1 Hsp70 family protein [Deltaproteobacteria bacterium]